MLIDRNPYISYKTFHLISEIHILGPVSMFQHRVYVFSYATLHTLPLIMQHFIPCPWLDGNRMISLDYHGVYAGNTFLEIIIAGFTSSARFDKTK